MESSSLSEYEQLRLQNIRRNRQFLQGIGLSCDSSTSSRRKTLSSSSSSSRRKRSFEISNNDANDDDNATSNHSQSNGNSNDSSNGFERRSLRLAQVPVVEYKESAIASLTKRRPTNGFDIIESKDTREDKESRIDADVDVYHHVIIPSSSSSIGASTTSKMSTQSLSASIDDLFLPSDRLGKQLQEFGKLFVITLANRGITPSFNKFAGALEWKNCVFLWVNIQGSTSSSESGYRNDFLKQGKEIVWFGGSRMTSDSIVVRRLVNAPKSQNCPSSMAEAVMNNEKQEDNERVVLFVRLEGEPYSCLGELNLVACNMSVHPIRFVWELQHYDLLKSGPNRENFERILDAAKS